MKRVKVKYGQNKISEKYEISEEGDIYELNNPNDVLKPYITTDGRKFCVLTEFDETRMFEIARLVAFSFGISSEGLTAGIRHKIEFINGDIADIRVDNIRWVDDPERWVDLGNLGFKYGLWYISSYGRIYGTRYKMILHQRTRCNGRYFSVGGLVLQNGQHKGMSIHRLVAMAFCPGRSIKYDTANHIDGDPSNNVYTNLEWTDLKGNAIHALYAKLAVPVRGENTSTAKMTNKEAELICQALLKFDGDVNKVCEYFNYKYSKYLIRDIRNCYSWRHISEHYFETYRFKQDPATKPIKNKEKPEPSKPKQNIENVTDSIAHEICKELLNSNGQVFKAWKNINARYPNIKRENVRSIARKISKRSISDQYFKEPIRHPHPRSCDNNACAKMTNQEAEKICELLVKYYGNVYHVMLAMKNDEFLKDSNISRIMINNVKFKCSWKEVSDKYFTKEDMIEAPFKKARLVYEAILRNDMSAAKAYHELKNDMPYLTMSYVKHVKNGNTYKELREEYK